MAEGLTRKPSPLVRRHLRTCGRCATFDRQLKHTKKSLAAFLPLGGFALWRKLAVLHLGHSAGGGSGATGTAGVSRVTPVSGLAVVRQFTAAIKLATGLTPVLAMTRPATVTSSLPVLLSSPLAEPTTHGTPPPPMPRIG